MWDQSVVVENMPGAGGSLGTANIAHSTPDGHRLLFQTSTYTTNAAAQPNLPFDPRADLQPIIKYADGDLIAVTGPRVPIQTIDDLIREANSQTIFFAGTGPASTPTFMAKLLSDVTGIDMEGAYYTGGADAMLDVIGGRVDLYIGTVTTVLSAVRSGQLTPLTVFSEERSPSLPDVPTISELGYSEATTTFWFGIFGPAGMPEDVVEKLNSDIADVMSLPETAALFAAQGARPAPNTPEEFTQLINSEIDKWSDLAVRFHIVAD